MSLPRHDWTREEMRALFDLPFPELMFRAQSVHRAAFRSDRSADFDAAVDQDRRLPGGLRLLPAKRALRHRRRGREADGGRRGARRSARREGSAAPPASAWARPGARRRTAISTPVCAMVEGVKALGLETCATLGMLTGAQAQRLKDAGPRLLQPQPRHLAGILRRDHHHAHLSGSAGHARPCARCRHQCLLRRHRRHGRDAATTASA